MLDNTNDSAEVRRLLAMNEANHASPSNFDQLANLINVPLFPRWLIYAVLLLVLASGTGLTVWRAQTADREMRIGLLSQAAALARTINPDLIKSLSFTAADQTSPAFLEIRRQMTTYGETLGLKNIFSQAIQQDRIVSGPDNRDEKSPQAVPPGTIYQGPSLASKEAFDRAEACTEGPYTDARGTFVSAFAPVKDPRTGKVLMMVGVDQEARDWNAALWRNRIVSLTFVVALVILLLAGDRLLHWRVKRQANHHRWLRHAEVCLTVAVGLSCTWIVTRTVGEHELRTRQELFLQAADGQTALVRQREAHIRDSLLPKLARFIGDNNQMTRSELHSYVRSASELAGVQTVEWIPCVPMADKNRFEADACRNGFTNLVIYGKYYQGEIMPAAGSPVYFPVVYAGPRTGNENDLSYNLGTEPLRQAALEQTRRTGLAAVTDPIKITSANTSLNSLLVYQPIFPAGSTGKTPSGFVLAVLRQESLLNQALADFDPDGQAVVMDEYQINPGGSRQWIASSPPSQAAVSAGSPPPALFANPESLTVVRPLFAFGKTYALVINPGPAFLAAHPERAAWLAGLAGLLLTAIVTALVGFMRHRQGWLEQEVRARTETLRVSEESYRHQFNDNMAVMLLINPKDGCIVDANRAAVAFYGHSRNGLLSRRVTDLQPQTGAETKNDVLAGTAQTGAPSETQHQLADDSVRAVEVYSSLVQFGCCPLLHLIVHDITPRKQSEAQLMSERDAALADHRRQPHFSARAGANPGANFNSIIDLADVSQGPAMAARR